MADAGGEQDLAAQNEALRATNAVQAVEIERLTRKIAELEERLNQGSSSSLPPSADSPKQQADATKKRADRRAEAKAQRRGELERRRGKQPGAPGQNLPMAAVPDNFVPHAPTAVLLFLRIIPGSAECALCRILHKAHVLRELEPISVRWDQGWANDMAALLKEMNNAAHDARDRGAAALAPQLLKSFLARYDAIVETGLPANPAPLHRGRDYLERRSFNLVTALETLKPEATRFAADLRVPMTNNLAERDLRMQKVHSKISSCFQSEAGARKPTTTPR